MNAIEKKIKYCVSKVRENDYLPLYKRFLYLKTDKAELVKFNPNSLQLKLQQYIDNDIKEKGYVRLIILKARRHGVSSFIEGRLFLKTTFTPYYNTAIVAHRFVATKTILEMSKLFYDKLDNDLKPEINYDNKQELSFLRTMSVFSVFTATEKASGRSAAFNALHASEAAYYPNDDAIESILQTIKDAPDTEIYFESTANAASGFFYELYKHAKLGNNDYTPVFFAWHEHPDYTRKFANKEEREKFLDSIYKHEHDAIYGDEELEMKTYNLSPEQMNWRRYAIDNKCNKKLDVFKREYPANDEECFLTSGSPVFNLTLCKYNVKQQTESPQTGYLKYGENDKVIFAPHPSDTLKIFTMPPLKHVHKYRYCAGVDTSDNVTGGDQSAVYIIDRLFSQLKVVCAISGYIDPDMLADLLIKVDEFYHKDVYYCIERSPSGNIVISGVAKKFSGRMYATRKFDKYNNQIAKDKIGFETDKVSKRMIINQLDSAIRNGKLYCPDKDFWEETFTFMYVQSSRSEYFKLQALNKNRRGSQNRYYDDRILAMALALEMHRVMPQVVKITYANPNSILHKALKLNEPEESWWVT